MNFEEAFIDFIDRREYDKAENALFSMVRISFMAGWEAAGGNPPKSQKILKITGKKFASTKDDIETDIRPNNRKSLRTGCLFE